ncbi:MAG: acetolactate synthase [Clostridiales bacterium]|nr:acetolactate synthase [Clostridiales bacterium]
MLINQISVFIENRPGRLYAITKTLSENDIDIRALSLADTTNFGILRLIVNDPVKADKVLRENGFTVSTTKVLAVQVEDKPGGLHSILEKLYEQSIGVEYAYAFITRKADGAFVILRVEDNEKAARYLKSCGVKIIEDDEIYSL